MRGIPRKISKLLAACIALSPLSSYGQATNSHAPPNTTHIKHIEGTIARIDGNELLLKVSGGTTETYQLSPTVQIARSRAGRMSDLAPGKFVGCLNLYGQSANKVAGECSILPDGLRGLVDNHADPASAQSGWTSGTITEVRDEKGAHDKGHRILMQIMDKDRTTGMAVTPVTKVAIVSASDASVLKQGVKVQGVSQQAVDGTEVIQTLTAGNKE